MRFFVVVQGDEIIVTSVTGFRAAYCMRPYHPQLVLRRRTQTDDHELLALEPGRRPMRKRASSGGLFRRPKIKARNVAPMRSVQSRCADGTRAASIRGSKSNRPTVDKVARPSGHSASCADECLFLGPLLGVLELRHSLQGLLSGTR